MVEINQLGVFNNRSRWRVSVWKYIILNYRVMYSNNFLTNKFDHLFHLKIKHDSSTVLSSYFMKIFTRSFYLVWQKL